MSFGEIVDRLFTFAGTGELLSLDFVQQSLIAGALLALIAGALGPASSPSPELPPRCW
jgi:zinc/manganese transport system permease protein